MSKIPEQFTGYAALTEQDGKQLKLSKFSYTPKKWAEDDVTIKVTHCSVCGSDVHQTKNGWPDVFPQSFPCICGHEVVGVVVEAGKKTTHHVGDRVGVGYQAGSCLECHYCKAGYTQYCEKYFIATMQGQWEDGSTAHGGFADYMRLKGAFAIKVPDSMDSAVAAPFFCGGVTVFSPLRRFGTGPGKKVGIIGIGGLGHMAVLFAKAMGADTYALSSSDRKREDSSKMGLPSENYVNYSDAEATLKKHGGSFDLILCTASGNNIPLDTLFLPLLKPFGNFCFAGLPEQKLPAYLAHSFLKGVSITGTQIGSPQTIKEMLDFAAEKGVKPWIEIRDMKDVEQALKDVEAGKPKYRYVLKN